MSKSEEMKTEKENLRHYLFVGLGLSREDKTLQTLLKQIEDGVKNSAALSAINYLVNHAVGEKLARLKSDVRKALDKNSHPGELK